MTTQLLTYSTTLLFYLSILFFIIGFNFTDVMVGNWYQQFMPNLGNRQVSDIFFLDSLTGWAVTPFTVQNDTTFVLRTTNSGDNWVKIFTGTGQFVGRNRIIFLNANTGFTCGNDNFSGSTKITKTTNGGFNWYSLNDPTTAVYEDMAVTDENTIWLVASSSLTGGVYRTTNGGASWDRQLDLGSQNPVKIYMFNSRIGYIAKNTSNSYIRKTTNSGLNWDTIVNGRGFSDMFFVDSLIGWTAFDSVRKTNNGGFNWQTQIMPYGGNFAQNSQMLQFSKNDNDTIWGVGGYFDYGGNPNVNRGVIYKTTNSGITWGFQLPDTSYRIPRFRHVNFVDRLRGWAYSSYFSAQISSTLSSGVHTTTGGDTTLMGMKQISAEVPKDFRLFQNYPNPFNPLTKFKVQVSKTAEVKIIIYDITGKLIETLVNQKLNTGEYEIDFNAKDLSSGVYFYSLIANGVLIDTKKMLLIK